MVYMSRRQQHYTSGQGHRWVFNESRGNPRTTWQAVAGPKITSYTGTVECFFYKLKQHTVHLWYIQTSLSSSPVCSPLSTGILGACVGVVVSMVIKELPSVVMVLDAFGPKTALSSQVLSDKSHCFFDFSVFGMNHCHGGKLEWTKKEKKLTSINLRQLSNTKNRDSLCNVEFLWTNKFHGVNSGTTLLFIMHTNDS